LIDLKIFGATFGIGGAIAPIASTWLRACIGAGEIAGLQTLFTTALEQNHRVR